MKISVFVVTREPARKANTAIMGCSCLDLEGVW